MTANSAILEPVLRRKVRRVVAEGGPAAEAIFTIAAGTRRQWDYRSWMELLAELDNCGDTVAEWMALRA